ncbi:CRISPR locus-related DNA-binding protein [Ferroglobus placidus DSM 10642]|uniref:CRISPR locus-related DNA-binding protein n=1 Tax=Ferroglobus placidus (strain DSM 10642 / AEDII12DO) TaxID=589924 RepID=D3RZU6_FERPA|nr:CRISPR-associated CARF protein Csa3 [Ferroglobus placidus]ADC66009.1 CRISPR locus-related DNA-binding protein [Ferroglobus placidus DSM 10642]
MATALIATLGFDEKFCYRAMVRNGIKSGDRVILITAGAVEKVVRAYEHVRNFAETSYDGVFVELVEVDPKNFVSGVSKILRILKELENYDLIVNLSGGMRVISLMVYTALAFSGKSARVEIELEDFSGVVEVEGEIFKLLEVKSKLSDEKVKLLKIVENEEMEAMKLAEIIGKDVTTVRRHIYELERLGLIEVVSRKPLKVRAKKVVELL